ncbi:MAG: hypothetical protein MRY79_09375 [Alphaproteobacteria bacterium]|nr:hypothetical protein [Alphaproteobacteria bacterium]
MSNFEISAVEMRFPPLAVSTKPAIVQQADKKIEKIQFDRATPEERQAVKRAKNPTFQRLLGRLFGDAGQNIIQFDPLDDVFYGIGVSDFGEEDYENSTLAESGHTTPLTSKACVDQGTVRTYLDKVLKTARSNLPHGEFVKPQIDHEVVDGILQITVKLDWDIEKAQEVLQTNDSNVALKKLGLYNL